MGGVARDPQSANPELPRVRIGLGIAASPFAEAREFFSWVDLCEESDVDSLWQTDRLISTQPMLEALSTMAALAGATTRMRFGMNAVVATLRDPLLLAKQCATIDFLSGGRLLPVFGVGSEHAPEWKATGQSPRRRGQRADEALEIVRRLWSEEKISFTGEFYDYRDVSIAPRPVQPELPLWIGGASPAAVRRTARIGTGWLGGIQTPAQVAPVIAAIREAAKEVGRQIPEDHYGASLPFRFGDPDDAEVRAFAGPGRRSPDDYLVVGNAGHICSRITAYHEAGASKFVLIPVAKGDRDLMDQTRRLITEVLPHFH